ncbi:MAG: peptidoglycan DD-metalloendopeptidase family protein, partial [Anaerolineae bacterium]|nr:peptidoglycan DD-metalloendopeptidase family protein [Anaerolineae bacterium]
MNRKNVTVTLILQSVCWILIVWVLAQELANASQAYAASATLQSTPQPFLGPIYYGRRDVLNVIDHDLPCASVCDDGPLNFHVLHHNGIRYDAVTATPNPLHTATPDGWPPPTPYIPDPGFGYDEHAGVDYLLKYVPVIAAADGDVLVANWANPSNHRGGFGLHVQLDHGTYTTLYAHLSVITVAQGDSVSADPAERNSIIGISGNTGSVLGGCPDVGTDPLCSAHLHFEVREGSGYKPVNPYGWTAPIETVDPWSVYINPQGTPAGAVSYNLWATPPALVSYADQYPGTNVPPVSEPAVNNARMIIDDGSADFSTIDTCWVYTPGNDSYNNSYRRANANGPNDCRARWTIRPDAFTLPGDYDVFVHIPEDSTASLGAVYTVTHNLKTSRAIVVQAAYLDNNTEHNAWAYLGRYDFAMNTAVSEFIELYDDTLADDAGNHVLADAIMLAPANGAMPLPQRYLYVSFASSGYAGNVPYDDEDILLFDAATGEWHMFFDGSDVGLAGVDIDAFDFRNGHLFFSLNAP